MLNTAIVTSSIAAFIICLTGNQLGEIGYNEVELRYEDTNMDYNKVNVYMTILSNDDVTTNDDDADVQLFDSICARLRFL